MDYDKLLNHDFPTVQQSYTAKDCMLYALGVGLGQDPLDEDSLRFVLEDDLKVVPSQAVMMAHPGFWAKEQDTTLDWVKVIHTGQEIIWHRPLPTMATVTAKTRITEIVDKGSRVGALILSEREVLEVATGEPICTLITTILARGDGGFSGERKPSPKPDAIPYRDPDYVCDLATNRNQALLYRLSGDFNPIHAYPAVAQEAGFASPILHGLCTLGVATHALLKTCCDYQADNFRRMRLRFSAPVYPGETIRTEIWRQDSLINFRCRSLDQNKTVINNGYLELG